MKLTVFTLTTLLLCVIAADAQKPSSTPRTKAVKAAVAQPTPDAAAEIEKALAIESADERMAALEQWLVKFPDAAQNAKARESLTVARAAVADKKLRENDAEGGIMLFKLAVSDLPQPIPEKLFTDVVSRFPANLYFRRQPEAAIEVAREIEARVADKPAQLVALASFYLSIEYSSEARRLALAAIEIDPSSSAAFQTLGMAERLSFNQPAAIEAYRKSIELSPEARSAKLNLADLLRGTGKPDEAIAIYRSMLETDPNDRVSRSGLTLALFAAGKNDEAESELAATLEQEPRNVILLGAAAYHFAADGNAERAESLAKQAIEIDPRYIWSHLALGRALMLKGQPIEAEKVFYNARRHGNFPLISYEIAASRVKAGFFDEAVAELKKAYSTDGDEISTKLGNRIERSAGDIGLLLTLEKQASIFEPMPVERAGETALMSALFKFAVIAESKTANDEKATQAAAAFVGTDDAMAPHRKLYAAGKLLDNNRSAGTAITLANDVVGKADDAVKIENASAVVMASELADGRNRAFAQNEFLVIPEVARPTLSAIMRGRIEETIGRAMLLQNDAAGAEKRFTRAVGVLPEKSAWWRSSVWQLGKAQETLGKDEDALKNYITSYAMGKPDMVKYYTVETLYKKVNGNTDGLEKLIGPNPLNASLQAANNNAVAPTPQPETVENKTVPVADATPQPESVEVKAETVAELTPQPEPVEEKTEEISLPTPQPVTVEENTETVPDPTPQPIEEKSETPVEEKTEVTADPMPQPVEENTEIVAQPTPQAEPVEQKPESLNETTSETTEKPKSLFEPIVIRVPSAPRTNPVAAPSKPADEKEAPTSADNRMRVVPGVPVTADSACTISLSQQTASLLNNGGSVGILLSIMGDGEPGEIIVENEFDDDIAVLPQPDIGVSGKKFYVVKSFSEKTGTFKVKFKSDCEEAILTVSVR